MNKPITVSLSEARRKKLIELLKIARTDYEDETISRSEVVGRAIDILHKSESERQFEKLKVSQHHAR